MQCHSYYSQTQHSTNEGILLSNSSVQCWWATTGDCRDEDSNPGPPGSEKSTLPMRHCPFLSVDDFRPPPPGKQIVWTSGSMGNGDCQDFYSILNLFVNSSSGWARSAARPLHPRVGLAGSSLFHCGGDKGFFQPNLNYSGKKSRLCLVSTAN